MELADGPLQTEPARAPGVPQAQPVQALANLDDQLDDAAVRQAIAQAEASGKDPQSITVSELVTPTQPAPVVQPEAPRQEVPQKFLKPDGEVDVEKLVTSTKQLDAAIQKKEDEIQKSVDDYVKEYRERESKFRNLPNPEKVAAQLPQTPVQPVPPPIAPMSDEQFHQQVLADFQRNPVMTITNLTDAIVEHRLKREMSPLQNDLEIARQERENTRIRENLAAIANKDPRVLNQTVFAAINAKLEANPELLRLKNPHKAAWLEVKEELRLGDFQPGNSAQPSKAPSPILGGGVPPSAPSSSASPQNVFSNLDKLDLRNRDQEKMGDAAIRAMLGGR